MTLMEASTDLSIQHNASVNLVSVNDHITNFIEKT